MEKKNECWSGLPSPSPGDLPDQGIESMSLTSPTLVGGFFTTSDTSVNLSYFLIHFFLSFFFSFLNCILFLLIFFKIFFSFIFISWRLITLQYCSSFCHTLTWISHGFTCVPHPDPPSQLHLYPIPLGLPSAPALSTCLMHPTWAGDLFHPW